MSQPWPIALYDENGNVRFDGNAVGDPPAAPQAGAAIWYGPYNIAFDDATLYGDGKPLRTLEVGDLLLDWKLLGVDPWVQDINDAALILGTFIAAAWTPWWYTGTDVGNICHLSDLSADETSGDLSLADDAGSPGQARGGHQAELLAESSGNEAAAFGTVHAVALTAGSLRARVISDVSGSPQTPEPPDPLPEAGETKLYVCIASPVAP